MSELVGLVTQDPTSGAPMIVTRLESPATGVVIEGRFDLGWVGRLTPEQREFVGLLLRHRTNLQRVATELGVAYNTVRSRLDDVVTAVGGAPRAAPAPGNADDVIAKLESGDLSFEDAVAELKGDG